MALSCGAAEYARIRTPRLKAWREVYCSGSQELHFAALITDVNGAPTLNRITASEVAQKFLDPALAVIGVAIATNCWQSNFGQLGANVNMYPDFSHHVPAVHVGLAKDPSSSPACCAETTSA